MMTMNAKNVVLRVSSFVILFALALILYDKLFGLSWHSDPNVYAKLNGKVSVEVYYEVLCPDSRHFVLKQLYPAWEKVGNIMDVHLKPYGKSTHKLVNGNYEFKCQHGPTECEGNMVHACAVKHLDKKPDLLMNYVKCMIEDNYQPLMRGQRCAESLAVDWKPIQRCVSDREGPALLALIGDDTHSLRPKVSFIPTILLNGSQDGQKQMLRNFLQEVCQKFQGKHPKNCLELL